MTVARKEYSDIDMQGNSLLNYVLAAGSVSLSWLATDPLARANHTGTQTASTISDLATVVQAYRLDQFAAPNTNLSINSNRITNLSDGIASSDAVTVSQLNAVQNGTIWVSVPVLCVATSNVSLTGEQTIDGVTTSGSLVLLSGQSTASQNGLWVTAAGAWARSVHLPAGANAANVSMYIEQGTTYADTQWRCTSNTGSAVVGTNNLTFTQFGAGTTYTADGTTLNLSGNTFSVATGGIGTTQLAANAVTIAKLGTITDGSTLDQSGSGSSLEIKAGGVTATQLASNAVTTAKITDANVTTAKIADGNVTDAKLASTFMKRYAANFGDGAATSFTITHSLGSKDVVVSVRLNSTDEEVRVYWVATSTSAITITVNGTAPATNALRVVVMG